MKCEDFRHAYDGLNDSRRRIEKSDLCPNMTAHLEKCADCTEYFETMNMVQLALVNMRREKIPPDLYWRLVKLGEEHGAANWMTYMKPVVIRVLKILVPVLPLWVIVLFVPQQVRAIIEMFTMTFGLTLMFEKMGRSLITNRI